MNDAAHNGRPLYQSLLGDSWHALPDEIRRLHDFTDTASARGESCVTRGRNPLARIIAGIVGFPHTAKRIDVRVVFTAINGIETWTRHFGNTCFHSQQYREDELLVETFGPLRFYMTVPVENGKLHLKLQRWSFLKIPLPMFLCPQSESYEYVADNKFHFHVRISHPVCGLIVHYHGWLLRTS